MNDKSLSKENRLKQEIEKNKKTLLILTEQIERLNIDLLVLKHEYDIRIGRLYLKLDKLDLEILKYTRIKKFISQGLTYDDAVVNVNVDFRNREEKIKEEYKNFEEKEEKLEKEKQLSEEDKTELRKIWKKLIQKYHPDLTTDEDEKKKREMIMRRINQAYSGADIDTLKTIEQEEFFITTEKETAEFLEKQLISIKNALKRLKQEYAILLKSEWFIWKKNIEKAKKQRRDLLTELEKKILEDIATKENLLFSLKQKYECK